MTRLDQALRWWRCRKCECRPGEFPPGHSKIVLGTSIPLRQFQVLSKTNRLMLNRSSPASYRLENDLSRHDTQ
jgi:hypothetical protein